MKKLFRILGIVLGALVGLVLVAVVAIFAISESQLSKTYAVTPKTVVIPTDADSIKDGERLANIRGCTGCHAPDLGGNPKFFENPLANLSSANLTRGAGGRGSNYTDEDWVRAIRHGVAKDGRGLWVMPANEYFPLSDADLGKIIAFVKQVPPVDRDSSVLSFGFLGRALLAAGQFKLSDVVPAAGLNHDAPRPATPAVGPTVEYGAYLALSCSGCHNANYSGGESPGTEPGEPIPTNLTQVMKAYTESQFIEFAHTGKGLGNRAIDNKYMPWETMGKYATETELKALFAYLQSLPARETGK
jgi:mono/diheme cytochrome c family protein